MSDNLQIEKINKLLIDVYRRLRNKEIGKEQAKCECDLLTSIIKATELNELQKEIINLKILLTKKSK